MKGTRVQVFRGLLLIVGIFLIGMGIWRGEMDMVWSKAVNLCLECVGIG